MKVSKGIVKKIWFSLTVLIIGYFFSILLEFFEGHQIASQLLDISERQLPIAQKSETALMAFKEQIHRYSNAIILRDSAQIEKAGENAGKVRGFLREIAAIKTHADPIYQDMIKTIKELDEFGNKAESVYTRLSTDFKTASADPEVTRDFRALVSQTNILQKRLKEYTIQFSKDLKLNLAGIRKTSQQQPYWNFLIFIGVVAGSILLFNLFILRSIVRPFQKNLMLKKVVEQFTDGIAVTDTNDKIWYVNQAWADIHGYTKAELKEQSMRLFYTAEQIEKELIPFNEKVQKEGSYCREVDHKRKDGFIFPVCRTTSKMLDEEGQAFCTVTTINDITLQRLKEEELCCAKNQAEVASIARSHFLANISHEIRTPLNGVMGMLNLLLSTDLDDEQLDLVNTGKSSADGLLTIISDILDFSKIQAGKLEMEIIDFDLRNTIEDVVALPSRHAKSKGLEFTYMVAAAIPSFLKGDPGRVRQILLNLTNNAIKFTEKGEILLRVTPEDENNSDVKLRFEVKDTGIGISTDKLSLIFQSFEQGDTSATRMYGGVGLGLCISKKLVELMQGEIGVESEPGKGSTFWFTIPFEKQLNDNIDDPVVSNTMHSKRFLLVDENKTHLEILGGYLKSWGCAFDVAMSGDMALSLLNAMAKVKAPFDLAIVDMMIPGMDGAEFGRIIKADPLLKDTKLVMITNMGLRGEASQMKNIGFEAYLTRPIRKSQLFDCLTSIFSERSQKNDTKKSALITRHTLAENIRNKTRILVVEDNVVNQKMVVKLIEKYGFTAEVAVNGKEALDRLTRFSYQMVLMDVQMPVMDGITATKNIRDPQTKVLNRDIPIVALTAHAMAGDKENCLEAGMNDYLTKPVNPEDLLAAIERNVLRPDVA